MDAENSRRSACDRCRGQKLRCVRPPRSTQSVDEQTLEPCVRCVKAGAQCVSALPTSRKATKDRGLPNPSPRTQPDQPPLQPLFPKVPKDNLLRKPSPEPDYQGHTEPGDQCNPRPAKRRSADDSHLAFGSPDFDPHSLSMGSSTTLSFGTHKEASFPQNGPFNVDITSYSLPSVPESCTKASEAASMMDILLDPASTTESNTSTFVLGTNWGEINASSDAKTPDSREDDLHRLSELNSRIVRDFKGVNSIAVADIISTLSRCEPESQSCGTEPMGPKSPIGRVLESSQTFLELLQGLKPNHYSYAESECSYSEFRDENEPAHLPPDPEAFADMTNRDSTTHMNSDMTAFLQSSSSLTPVDMPMTLIILTCYTMLLQTYETIFSRIHESLFSHEKLSRRFIPPILPGLHIGGFYLNKHQDLQMDILISLSYKMLERIEEALGINVISEPQNPTSNYMSQKRGLLETSYASAILDVMFKQKGLGHSQNYRGERIAMVKQTMESIRHMFRQKH